MKKLLLILFVNFTLLFSPASRPATTDPYGRYVHLNSHMSFFLNSDTYGFILTAIDPSQLLTYHHQRQSRPLFILAGTVVGYSVNALTWPVHRQLTSFYRTFWRGSYPAKQILLIGNFYFGYFLINILVLWLSLYLFEKIFNLLLAPGVSPDYLKYIFMIFIVANPITKVFFWAIHKQMFAFLTPLLCIYILLHFKQRNLPVSLLRWGMIFFAAGLLLLVYGNFLMLIPVLLYAFLRDNGWSRLKSQKVLPVFCLLLICSVPTIAWLGILKLHGMVYFNFEMRYAHELIWIPESLRQSTGIFFHNLGSFTIEYMKTMLCLVILLFFSFVIFLAAKVKILFHEQSVRDTAFVFTCFFLFYWILQRTTEKHIDSNFCLLLERGTRAKNHWLENHHYFR